MNSLARWCLGAILFLLFLWIAFFNDAILWQELIRKKKTASWVPVFGGALGAVSFLIFPVPRLARWFWLPLILDYGCLPGILHTAFFFVIRWRRSKKDI